MSAEAATPVAPAAAAAAGSPVSFSPVPVDSIPAAPKTIVEVEEDPAMKEALADQKAKVRPKVEQALMRGGVGWSLTDRCSPSCLLLLAPAQAPLISEFREKMAPFLAEHPNSQLVQEFRTQDRVVYRFLQARKFDLEKADLLFHDAIKMRAEKQLDGILHRACPKGLEYKILSKHGWHGYDKYGRVIFVKNTGHQHFPSLYSAGDVAERVHYNTYLNEYLRYVVMPEANARIGHKYEIDQVVTIVNLKDFGFHCIKKHNYGTRTRTCGTSGGGEMVLSCSPPLLLLFMRSPRSPRQTGCRRSP